MRRWIKDYRWALWYAFASIGMTVLIILYGCDMFYIPQQ